MNIIFFGTPDFVLPVLQSLYKAEGINLAAVVTAPDKPVGRKQILTPTPVKQWATKQNIPILTPERLDNRFKFQISNFKFQIFVVAAYGKIIPQEIIQLPEYGSLGIHPSLLPKYRGASPAQAAIINGDKETGVAIYKMDEKMDHGQIVAQFQKRISEDETAESLYQKLFNLAAQHLPEILFKYKKSEITLEVQDEKQATYTQLLKKEDGFIPFEFLQSAQEGKEVNEQITVTFIKNYTSSSPNNLEPYTLQSTPFTLTRLIHALSPWPGAWTKLPSGKRLKILKSHVENDKLVLDLVQLEGKKPTNFGRILSKLFS